MRFGQLDAGVFTAFGLKLMVPESFVVTLPGLLRDERELDFILDNYVRRFDDRFRDEGFEILAWSKTGWAYVYGKQPIRTPDDLRKASLMVDNSDNAMTAAFKSLGFNVVPISINEIMVSLQSGLINSFYAPPVAAAAYQWFALAPHQTEYRLAPVIGGLVLSERAWSRIPERYHAELKASMERVARDFYAESLRLNDEALQVMGRNGLVRVELTDAQRREWMEVMAGGHDLLVGEGKAIPQDLYDELNEQLDRLRAGER